MYPLTGLRRLGRACKDEIPRTSQAVPDAIGRSGLWLQPLWHAPRCKGAVRVVTQRSALQLVHTDGKRRWSTLPKENWAADGLQKLINKQCRARYWEFLQLCEDTGIDALGELVEQEKENWIRKYTESRAEYEQQLAEWSGSSYPSDSMVCI